MGISCFIEAIEKLQEEGVLSRFKINNIMASHRLLPLYYWVNIKAQRDEMGPAEDDEVK